MHAMDHAFEIASSWQGASMRVVEGVDATGHSRTDGANDGQETLPGAPRAFRPGLLPYVPSEHLQACLPAGEPRLRLQMLMAHLRQLLPF
jgi:hypothetical protein